MAQRPLSSYVQQDLVAKAGARVGEALALYVDKPPAVRAGAEVELENTRRTSFHFLYSRSLVGVDINSSRCAPGPGHELADAVLRICCACGGYRGEALVAVGVPIYDYLGVIVVEDLPEGLHVGIRDVVACGIERVMEVGQGAPLVGGVGEVVAKPFALGRCLFASAHLVAVAVKGHDVPGSLIVGIVALAWCNPALVFGTGARGCLKPFIALK
jgi:hypothetical protein